VGIRYTDPVSLSPREDIIAGLVVTGWDNKEIARRTGLSSKTVARYIRNIFEKMECMVDCTNRDMRSYLSVMYPYMHKSIADRSVTDGD
jgi:DNA-binding CsgD family transcriptional regulator